MLRCLNRMNDLVRGFASKATCDTAGGYYHSAIDPVAVRRFIGMVFQQPNPFATSIYNNVAFGLRLNGFRGDTAEKSKKALRGAALWDEVKDKLQKKRDCRYPAASNSVRALPARLRPSRKC